MCAKVHGAITGKQVAAIGGRDGSRSFYFNTRDIGSMISSGEDREAAVLFPRWCCSWGGASGVSMRPKIAMWSDYRSPTKKHWKSPYRRNTRSSIGLKILLAAVVLVAGVIGISGIYPQIIDSEWVRNAGTHAKRPALAEATTKRAVGPIAAVPLSPRGAATTTGDAAASAPRAAPSGPATVEPQQRANSGPRPSSVAAATDVSPNETAPPRADVPDAQALAEPPTEPTAAAAPVVRPAQRYVARAPVVKKRVARAEHRRSNSSAYAQYGGGWGGGWGGYSGFGSPYHF
jgi:hypothetical protein